MSAGEEHAARADAPDIRVESRSVTPEEVAAVTAVLAAAIEEHKAASRQPRTRGDDAWERTRRPLRAPLERGLDEWRAGAI